MEESDTDNMTLPNQLKAQHKIEEERHDHVRTYRRYGTTGALLFAAGIAWKSRASARTITTTIQPSHGPVQILGCRAALQPFTTDEGYTLLVWLDFNNAGTKTATAVRFDLQASDAFGMPLQSATGDRQGTFAPDVIIQNWLGSNAKAMTGLLRNVGKVACSVEMVQLSDGSQWRGVEAQPTLYYPLTPSPP
jgi:hypothetical protein